jgi:short-subunit dehydrogenase
VTYLCPGFVKTGFFRDFPPDFRLPPDALEPEEVADQVLRILARRNTRSAYFSFLTRRFSR